MSERKPKLGRPTKYKPEYDQMLIDHMAKGYSFESFAGRIKVAGSTIYEWVEKHDAFREAKKKAFEENRFFWEGAGLEGLYMGGKDNPFNSTIWIFNMKNRFPKQWRDRQEIKQESKVTLESLIEETVEDDE
jgi:hypothetical protein